MSISQFTLGLAQCCHPEGERYEDVLVMAEKWCEEAKEEGVDILVFPESLMTRYEKDQQAFLSEAQTLDGPFSKGMDALAQRYGLWLIYTVNEKNLQTNHPFNTAVIVSDSGMKRGAYRKVHLFDTDFTKESDRMSSGDALFEPIETPFGKIGLGICYDLRFPEVARFAALKGCDLLVYPAAWVDGRLKADQWRTLLAARAIENEIFVAGLSRVDKGYLGQSGIFGPDGVLIASGGQRETLITARIDLREIKAVRSAMPVLLHRKPTLYLNE